MSIARSTRPAYSESFPKPYLVRLVPSTRNSPLDFKSPAFTDFATPACIKKCLLNWVSAFLVSFNVQTNVLSHRRVDALEDRNINWHPRFLRCRSWGMPGTRPSAWNVSWWPACFPEGACPGPDPDQPPSNSRNSSNQCSTQMSSPPPDDTFRNIRNRWPSGCTS